MLLNWNGKSIIKTISTQVTANDAKFVSSREKYTLYYERLGKEELVMNTKLIKGIGIAASVIGAVATVAGNWATNKETDNKIAENVTKAVAEALKKEA